MNAGWAGRGDELIATIHAAFERLTGFRISNRDSFCVERFRHGGVSSGYVDPQFWREVALPLLGGRDAARYFSIDK